MDANPIHDSTVVASSSPFFAAPPLFEFTPVQRAGEEVVLGLPSPQEGQSPETTSRRNSFFFYTPHESETGSLIQRMQNARNRFREATGGRSFYTAETLNLLEQTISFWTSVAAHQHVNVNIEPELTRMAEIKAESLFQEGATLSAFAREVAITHQYVTRGIYLNNIMHRCAVAYIDSLVNMGKTIVAFRDAHYSIERFGVAAKAALPKPHVNMVKYTEEKKSENKVPVRGANGMVMTEKWPNLMPVHLFSVLTLNTLQFVEAFRDCVERGDLESLINLPDYLPPVQVERTIHAKDNNALERISKQLTTMYLQQAVTD